MSLAKAAAIAAGLALFSIIGAAQGAPPPSGPGGICGGIAGFQCGGTGLFCEMTPPARCGAGDMSGVCRRRPAFCPMIYHPVCGCDGKTYANDCQRRAAGAAKLANGRCR